MIQERIQSVINSLSDGAGNRVMRFAIAGVLVAACFTMYARSQFHGLREADAMEAAQVARNLAEERGYTTRCIRPADMDFLADRQRAFTPDAFPDIRTPPLHPFLLSLGLRVFGLGRGEAPADAARADHAVVAPLGVLFTIVSAAFLYLVGGRLFDRRVGAVAAVLYLLSDAALAVGLGGTSLPLGTALLGAAVYLAVLAVDNNGRDRRPAAWLLPALAVGVLTGLAFLSLYALIVFVPVLAVYLAVACRRWEWGAVSVFIVGVLVVVAPWVARNQVVSGAPLGSAPRLLMNDTRLYPEDGLDRAVDPVVDNTLAVPALRHKLIEGMFRSPTVQKALMGGGVVLCFFIVGLFHRFDEPRADVLRWCLVAGALVLWVVAALWGRPGNHWLTAMLPAVLLFGTAYVFVILDRPEMEGTGWGGFMVGVLIVLTALPAAVKAVALPASRPYPPYFPPFVQYVTAGFDETEVLCTDIPWATAWYGGQPSLLLPPERDDVVALRRTLPSIAGIYLTTRTADRAYTTDLVSGSESSWLPLLQRRVPAGFPFTEGLALPPGTHDQLLLTDRIRWPVAAPVAP